MSRGEHYGDQQIVVGDIFFIKKEKTKFNGGQTKYRSPKMFQTESFDVAAKEIVRIIC